MMPEYAKHIGLNLWSQEKREAQWSSLHLKHTTCQLEYNEMALRELSWNFLQIITHYSESSHIQK
jgi:hypothetical protein